MTTKEAAEMLRHLLALGLPQHLSEHFVSKVVRWCVKSGDEWTVKRLKSLKQYSLSLMQGKPDDFPVGWQTRKSRKGRRIFADPTVRYIFDLNFRSNKDLRLIQGFLASYKVITLKRISKSQLKDYMKSVTSRHDINLSFKLAINNIVNQGLDRLLEHANVRPDSKDCYYPTLADFSKSDKSSPYYFKAQYNLLSFQISGYKAYSVKRSDAIPYAFDFLTTLIDDPDWSQIWHLYPEEFSERLLRKGELIRDLKVDNIKDDIYVGLNDFPHLYPVGVIGFIQEGGCKLRAVANPLLAVQALGEPLKIKLERITKCISNIGTFDQTSAQMEIIQWLNDGCRVWSYDCSSFTDRFPYFIQAAVLRNLLEKGFITPFDFDVFETVVNKRWCLPTAEYTTVRWEVGQPMGFGPSFHLATLSHAALLSGLSSSVLFKVVGDDVAIGDENLSKLYLSTLTKLGVDISLHKSIQGSASYAEFCGKLLVKEGIIPSIKPKVVTSPDQLVKNLEFYGVRGLRYLLSNEEIRWAVKALLPLENGGLGRTLVVPGMSFDDWMSLFKHTKMFDKVLCDYAKSVVRPPYVHRTIAIGYDNHLHINGLDSHNHNSTVKFDRPVRFTRTTQIEPNPVRDVKHSSTPTFMSIVDRSVRDFLYNRVMEFRTTVKELFVSETGLFKSKFGPMDLNQPEENIDEQRPTKVEVKQNFTRRGYITALKKLEDEAIYVGKIEATVKKWFK